MTTERLPTALRVAQLLRAKIERLEYLPGEWLPTERDLAVEFSVDRATIRAAIAQLAKERHVVREPGRRPWVRVESGQPVPPADGTMPPKSKTIAAVIPQPANYPALTSIQRGILKVLQKDDMLFRLIVFDNQGDVWRQSVERERRALEAIECEGIAGAILWQIGRGETLAEIARVQNKGIPLVLLDRFPESIACDFVGVDNRAAAADAVRYLLQLGHRRIAHLTTAEAISTGLEREQGYKDALRDRAIAISDALVFRLPDRDELYPDLRAAVDHFLSLSSPPTAVFAMKDLHAHAFITEVQARGLRVPEDISVIGFDDHDRFSLQPPILTTMHQPFERMGQCAAELLLRRLDASGASNGLGGVAGTDMPFKHLLLPTPLVTRSTCAPVSA